MNQPDRSRFQYNQDFLDALEMLNPQQKAAVDQIEGPVLVIAGPGTGKTHILSARIGKILIETDTQAGNILCLTFTEAGVRAMRSRLIQLIGPEAHRIHIYTFHAFCNTIIQDNLEKFGRQDLEPISPLEKVELIRDILQKLDVEHPLKKGRADIFFYESHLQVLFQQMKMESWTPAFIREKVDAFLADLPNQEAFIYQVNRRNFKKGDLKVAKFEEASHRMELLKAAADLYPKYIHALNQIRRYDYDDMILWVLKAFEQNEYLLRTYQEQYLYFLVDEYQDTNGAQNKILMKLIEYWENPNVFIVGDDDQSIFEFQGARLKNLVDFYILYKDNIQIITLASNYRSSQPVLDNAAALIQYNQKRIIHQLKEQEIDKKLSAANPTVLDVKTLPKLWIFPNRTQEEVGILNALQQLIKEGVPPDHIAVIYAQHKQSDGLIEQLEKNGIPYQTRRKVNILNLPIIQNLRLMLSFVRQEFEHPGSGDPLLFKLMHLTWWNIPIQDLYKLGAYRSSLKPDKSITWFELIQNRVLMKKIGLQNSTNFEQLASALRAFQSSLVNDGLPNFVEGVINSSGLLDYIFNHPQKLWLVEVVRTFIDFVKGEANRKPRITLVHLMETLKRMDANRLPIEVLKTMDSGPGIQLLSAHSAKGLEFDHVFMIDCVKSNWEPKGRNRGYRFQLPDTLTYSGEEDALEARRRLFYVAMTRAKTALTFSYSLIDKNDRNLEPSQFIQELLHENRLELEERTIDTAEMLLNTKKIMNRKAQVSVKRLNKEVVDTLLDGFVMSVTALNRYLRCPLSFFYVNVLKAPTAFSEAAAFGTAMHNTLQRAFENMLRNKEKLFPTEGLFLEIFEWEMEKLSNYFSRNEWARRLEIGKRYLVQYRRAKIKGWPTETRVEFSIRNIELDGVPVIGTIDRMDYLPQNKLKLVDYKTGTQQAGKTKRPTKANPHGGVYWRQMNFYKLLVESTPGIAKSVEKAIIAYVEPEIRGGWKEVEIEISPKDQGSVRTLIKDVYTQIKRHNFYEGCGEANCEWCNFVQNNEQIQHRYDKEQEEMDDG